jgi:hypothetical protein
MYIHFIAMHADLKVDPSSPPSRHATTRLCIQERHSDSARIS